MESTLDDAGASQALNNQMLDYVIKTQGLKNDAALSRALAVAPPVISKIRHGRLPIGSGLLISIHELTDCPIRKLKGALGMKCLAAAT